MACTCISQQYIYVLFLSLVSLLGYALGLWQLGALLLFPLVIIKIPFNLLILRIVCKAIAAVDLNERTQSHK